MPRDEMTFTKNQVLMIQKCIDALGIALARTDHQWTPQERRLFERASSALQKASDQQYPFSGPNAFAAAVAVSAIKAFANDEMPGLTVVDDDARIGGYAERAVRRVREANARPILPN